MLILELLYKYKSQLPKIMEESFEKMTSRGTLFKYPYFYNSGEHESKLQKLCEK